MGLNKEDFRHSMLDSHRPVGKVLLSKKSLQKLHRMGAEKDPAVLLRSTWHLWRRQCPAERASAHRRARRARASAAPVAASAAAACKGEGGK